MESVKVKAIILGDDVERFEESFNVDSDYIEFDSGGLRWVETG